MSRSNPLQDYTKENYVNGNQPLHFAASTASLGAAKLLVEAGANATAENHEGYTPADYANRQRWNYDMRVYLRTLGADCTMGEDCRDDSKGPPPKPTFSSQRIDL